MNRLQPGTSVTYQPPSNMPDEAEHAGMSGTIVDGPDDDDEYRVQWEINRPGMYGQCPRAWLREKQ